MGMTRSENMRRIRSRDTRPELEVRKLLRSLGYKGYRLHRKDLPGKPDIAFLGRRKAILIHGCFWHGHSCKTGARKPITNSDYWVSKIDRNKQRDITNAKQLLMQGWSILTIWECELRNMEELSSKIISFMATN